MAISPAHLARLETDQRGLYVEDFVSIVDALDEKPGNLLPNDVGAIGHDKPLVDRLAAAPPELLPEVTAILADVVALAERVFAATPKAARGGKSPVPPRRKGRR